MFVPTKMFFELELNLEQLQTFYFTGTCW